MFKARTDIKLTINNILSKVNEYDIFERYLGIKPELKKFYVNPLRKDEDAGCNFYISNSNGRLYFKDYSYGYHWDCIEVVVIINGGCSVKEALSIIARDFNLNNYFDVKTEFMPRPPEIKSKPPVFQIKRREFNAKDLAFWNQFYITKELLDKFYVYAVETAWSVTDLDTKEVYSYKFNYPCYAFYLGNDELKLYLPFNKKPYPRFFHSIKHTLQGYYLLPEEGENLIFTKSYKDVIAISGIFDIPAIATQSENVLPRTLDFGELYNRFDNIYCLYDNDMPGKRATIKLKNMFEPITPLLFPKTMNKDFSDNLKVIGIDNMRELINKVL